MSGLLVIDCGDFAQLVKDLQCGKCSKKHNGCESSADCLFQAEWHAEKLTTPLYQICDEGGMLLEPTKSQVIREIAMFGIGKR